MGADFGALLHPSPFTTAGANHLWNEHRRKRTKYDRCWELYNGERDGLNGLRVVINGKWRLFNRRRAFVNRKRKLFHRDRVGGNGHWDGLGGFWERVCVWTKLVRGWQLAAGQRI